MLFNFLFHEVFFVSIAIQYILGGLKYIWVGSTNTYIFELEDVKMPQPMSLLRGTNKANDPGFFKPLCLFRMLPDKPKHAPIMTMISHRSVLPKPLEEKFF